MGTQPVFLRGAEVFERRHGRPAHQEGRGVRLAALLKSFIQKPRGPGRHLAETVSPASLRDGGDTPCLRWDGSRDSGNPQVFHRHQQEGENLRITESFREEMKEETATQKPHKGQETTDNRREEEAVNKEEEEEKVGWDGGEGGEEKSTSLSRTFLDPSATSPVKLGNQRRRDFWSPDSRMLPDWEAAFTWRRS